MLTYIMGEMLDGMEYISTYPIIIDSLSNIEIGRVDRIFRPRSTYAIITTYTIPLVNIITTYISPPITIITTDITPLSAKTTID